MTQHAVYYDTSDLRLTRSGVSLRYRSDDGWTVKLPEARTASTLTRSELTFGGDRGAPPAPARSLVRAYSRTRPLVEIAKIETCRSKTKLLDAGGDLLAEIDDDDVTGTSADGRQTQFREIEVELGERHRRLVPRRCRASVAQGRRSPVARDVEDRRGARRRGRQASRRSRAEPASTRDATVADLVRAAIVRSLQQLQTYDPAVRLSDDSEAVHKARVATRRLRSDLRTFRPVLERAWSEPLRAELQWLGRALGKVRDADVLLDALAAQAAALPDEHQPAATQLRRRLAAARRRDREALLETLDSDRYVELLDQLVAAAEQPRFRDGAAEQPARRSPGASSPSRGSGSSGTRATSTDARPTRRCTRRANGRSRSATRRRRSRRSSASGRASWPNVSPRCNRSSASTRTRSSPARGSSMPRATPTIGTRRSWRASSPGSSSMRSRRHARSGRQHAAARCTQRSERRSALELVRERMTGLVRAASCPAPGTRIDVTRP